VSLLEELRIEAERFARYHRQMFWLGFVLGFALGWIAARFV